jgi:hypothetical protein
LTKEEESSEKVTYTFTMGTGDVNFTASTTKMTKITYTTDSTKVKTFTVTDTNTNQTISNNGYVVPGHTVSVYVAATDNYYVSKTVSTPTNASGWTGSSDYDSATYTFTAVENTTVDVSSGFTINSNPTLTVGRNDTDKVSNLLVTAGSYSKYDIIKYSAVTSKKSGAITLRPGTSVTVTADSGSYTEGILWGKKTYYYKPTYTLSDTSISSTSSISPDDKNNKNTITVIFTMGESGLTVTFDGTEY